MRDIAVMPGDFFQGIFAGTFRQKHHGQIDRKLIDRDSAQSAGTRAPAWCCFNDLGAEKRR
jgi:hypothetical protein